MDAIERITLAIPILKAYAELSDDMRAEAIELIRQLDSGTLDDDERYSTLTLLTEFLMPDGDSI